MDAPQRSGTRTPATSGSRNASAGPSPDKRQTRRNAYFCEVNIDNREKIGIGDVHQRVCLERRADTLLCAFNLKRAGDYAAHLSIFASFSVNASSRDGPALRKRLEMD